MLLLVSVVSMLVACQKSPPVSEVEKPAPEAHQPTSKAGAPVELTAHQFELLWALAASAGRVLSRDDLSRAVKGEDAEPFDRSIDVHVSRIRAAIEDDPKKPRRIITLRGVGYLFARQQD